MRRLLIAFTIASTVATCAWWLHAHSSRPGLQPTIPSLSNVIHAAGRVEGVRPESTLRTWEYGRVMAVHVQDGDVVEANELLVTLDDDLQRAEVAIASEVIALYRVALAQLEQAKLTWQRTQSLHSDGVVTPQQADRDRTNLIRSEAEVAAAKARLQLVEAPARKDETNAAQARVAAARAKLELSHVYLQRRQLRAPFAGRILKVNVEPGEMTGPQSIEPVMVLAETNHFRVRAFVEELEAPQL